MKDAVEKPEIYFCITCSLHLLLRFEGNDIIGEREGETVCTFSNLFIEQLKRLHILSARKYGNC
jgi:hypothetical protein